MMIMAGLCVIGTAKGGVVAVKTVRMIEARNALPQTVVRLCQSPVSKGCYSLESI